jgi:hypothetical protein
MAFAGPTYGFSRSSSEPVPVARSLACWADAQRRCRLAVQVALAAIHVASRASSAPTETPRVSAARTSQSAEMGGSMFQSLIALGLRLVRHPLPLAVQLVRSGLPKIPAHTRAASSARVTRVPGAMVAARCPRMVPAHGARHLITSRRTCLRSRASRMRLPPQWRVVGKRRPVLASATGSDARPSPASGALAGLGMLEPTRPRIQHRAWVARARPRDRPCSLSNGSAVCRSRA